MGVNHDLTDDYTSTNVNTARRSTYQKDSPGGPHPKGSGGVGMQYPERSCNRQMWAAGRHPLKERRAACQSFH